MYCTLWKCKTHFALTMYCAVLYFILTKSSSSTMYCTLLFLTLYYMPSQGNTLCNTSSGAVECSTFTMYCLALWYCTLCVYCTLCTAHYVCTVHFVLYTVCVLYTLYCTLCVYCTLCTVHTVCNTSSSSSGANLSVNCQFAPPAQCPTLYTIFLYFLLI